MKTSNLPACGRAAALLILPTLVGFAACERTKTSNPLSPQVAGPMEGVTITAPLVSEPRVGQKVKDPEQPITLVMFNPVSNIGRPIKLTVQIAAEPNFLGPVSYTHLTLPTILLV